MQLRFYENAPECVDHLCARCLGPVGLDAEECPSCSRRFVGRGRFDLLADPPPAAESLQKMEAIRR
jgi:hypothetical protein